MRLGRDGIAGLIGLAVSLGLIPFALGLPKLPIVPVGPGFYPMIVLACLALTCAALVLQDLAAQRRPAPGVAAEAAERPKRDYRLVLAAFAVVGAYISLLPMLGFRIATALFVAAFQIALDRPKTIRQWLVLLLIAVGTAAVTYLVFDQYLSVLLPRGSWTNW
jgi:putative tricarboxylic transport membrane protein